MKRWWIIALLCLMLTGCDETVYETMSDLYEQPEQMHPAQVLLILPQDAALMTAQGDTDNLYYFCEDHTISIQTLMGGDLDKTLKAVSGYSRDKISLVGLSQEELDRYEFVWVVAGEQGDEICRGVILDDGYYHYVLTLQASAEVVAELQQPWNQVASTFSLDTAP